MATSATNTSLMFLDVLPGEQLGTIKSLLNAHEISYTVGNGSVSLRGNRQAVRACFRFVRISFVLLFFLTHHLVPVSSSVSS